MIQTAEQERQKILQDNHLFDVDPGEANAFDTKFSQSVFFPWLEGSFSVKRDQRIIQIRKKNTLFGMIPAGEMSDVVRISEVSSVNTYYAADSWRILVSIICLAAALRYLPWDSVSGLFWLKIAILIGSVLLILASVQTGLRLQKSGDIHDAYILQLPFYEWGKMRRAKHAVENALIRVDERSDVERAAHIVANAVRGGVE